MIEKYFTPDLREPEWVALGKLGVAYPEEVVIYGKAYGDTDDEYVAEHAMTRAVSATFAEIWHQTHDATWLLTTVDFEQLLFVRFALDAVAHATASVHHKQTQAAVAALEAWLATDDDRALKAFLRDKTVHVSTRGNVAYLTLPIALYALSHAILDRNSAPLRPAINATLATVDSVLDARKTIPAEQAWRSDHFRELFACPTARDLELRLVAQILANAE